MPRLLSILLSLLTTWGSRAVFLGTVVNILLGAAIVFSSVHLFENLQSMKGIFQPLNGTIQGQFSSNWYRVANFYLPVTECLEMTAVAFGTYTAVLFIRVMSNIRSAYAPKNPLTGV